MSDSRTLRGSVDIVNYAKPAMKPDGGIETLELVPLLNRAKVGQLHMFAIQDGGSQVLNSLLLKVKAEDSLWEEQIENRLARHVKKLMARLGDNPSP